MSTERLYEFLQVKAFEAIFGSFDQVWEQSKRGYIKAIMQNQDFIAQNLF